MRRIRKRLLTGLLCMVFLMTDVMSIGLSVQASESGVSESMVQKEADTEGADSDLPEDAGKEEESGTEGADSDLPEDTGKEEGTGTEETDSDLPEDTGKEEGTGTEGADSDLPEDTGKEEETGTEETGSDMQEGTEGEENPNMEETEDGEPEDAGIEAEEEETEPEKIAEDGKDAQILAISEDEIRASGSYKDITWVLDLFGNLTIEGAGDYDTWGYYEEPELSSGESEEEMLRRKNYYSRESPWSDYCYSIKSAEVNVTGMTNAAEMFSGCKYLTSVDFSGFDTSTLINTRAMFSGCEGLPESALSGFDTSNVKIMNSMFSGCNFESLDLSSFDTSNVVDMNGMFMQCLGQTGPDLSNFDTRNVTDMAKMFLDCSELTSLNLSSFDTANVTDMDLMFGGCSGLTSLDLSSFNTTNVINMDSMFEGCSGLTSLDVSSFDTAKIPNMRRMFSGCSGLISLDLSNFDTRSVTYMGEMFRNCNSLTSLDVSGFDTRNVTDMSDMFRDCSGLTNLDVSGFDTGNVTTMERMFWKCSGLTSLNVSNFNTRNVWNMTQMFYSCDGLTGLDLSSFDCRKVRLCSNILSLYTANHKEPFTLYTPRYLMSDMVAYEGREYLPGIGGIDAPMEGGVPQDGPSYYDVNGNEYRLLPKDLDHSIVLRQGQKPSAAERITAIKTKTSYLCGETLDIQDLRVMYYGVDGAVQQLSEGYTTNADDIDMSTPGKKTLTVTYVKDGGTLTDQVTLTVVWGLDEDHVKITLSGEGSYTYNRRYHTPVPTVVYLSEGTNGESGTGITLREGIDYKVSYRNNTNAYEGDLGEGAAANAPAVIITGMGEYKGKFIRHFRIAKAAAPENEEFEVFASECRMSKNQRKLDLSGAFAAYGQKVYSVEGYEESNPYYFFTKPPETSDISKLGILTYHTQAGKDGDFAVITFKVSFTNYQDALLKVRILMTEKMLAVISGITIKNSVYNGNAVSYSGSAVVKSEDGTDISGQVTLVYDYSGIQADGTSYPAVVSGGEAASDAGSTEAPVNAGTYVLKVTITDNDGYVGSAVYPFTIEKAPLTVTAQDVTLVQNDPLPTVYKWDAKGLIGKDTFIREPSLTFTDDKGASIEQVDLNTDEEHIYHICPGGADAGMNYEISYYKGILAVYAERVGYQVTFDLSGHGKEIKPVVGVKAGSLIEEPEIPLDTEGKYFFGGWYKDRTFASKQKWNFMSDTVQSNITLYACWISKAAEGNENGLKVCIQDIPYQTYTGSALKPNILVYGADGETLLKTGKDYTVKYVNNTNAVSVDNAGNPKRMGGTAEVTDPGKRTEKRINIEGTFTSDLPYIVFTGKGNYKETIYKNFIILPADISDIDENGKTTLASGYTLKYTEQTVKSISKTQTPFQSLKYKKKMSLGTDFTVTLHATENVKCDASVSVETGAAPSVWTGETIYNSKTKKYTAPAIPKGYYGTFTMTITGSTNYTGEVTGNIYVADNAGLLMKNAKITLGKNQKTLQYGQGEQLKLTPGYYDAADKKYYIDIEGNKTETGKDDLFTVSVKNGKTTVYLRYNNESEKDSPYFISYRNNQAVGTATMTIEGNSAMGYVGSKSVTFKIKGADFTEKTVKVKNDGTDDSSLQARVPYTGKAVTQNKVLLTVDGANNTPQALTYGVHYTISYKNNIKKGTATMTFTAKPESGYSGSFKKTFKITAQSLRNVIIDGENITTDSEDIDKNTKNMTWKGTDAVYSKNGATLSVHLKNAEGIALKQGTDYTVSYQNNKAVSTDAADKTPLMIIKGKGNYAGSLKISFKIAKADIGDAIANGMLSVSCAAVMKKAVMKFADFKFKVKEGKKTLKSGQDYTLVLDDCTDTIIRDYADALTTNDTQGTEPKVTIRGQGSYTGEKEISLAEFIYVTKLTSRNLAVTVTGDRTYTGSNVEPEVSVAYYPKNNAGKNGAIADSTFSEKDYQVTYGSNNKPAGKKKGSITITGKGVYGGNVTVKFDIEKRAIY